ncbi:hypothetical protein SAURM35S_05963 [Streptomyces aurantiogriseus]
MALLGPEGDQPAQVVSTLPDGATLRREAGVTDGAGHGTRRLTAPRGCAHRNTSSASSQLRTSSWMLCRGRRARAWYMASISAA